MEQKTVTLNDGRETRMLFFCLGERRIQINCYTSVGTNDIKALDLSTGHVYDAYDDCYDKYCDDKLIASTDAYKIYDTGNVQIGSFFSGGTLTDEQVTELLVAICNGEYPPLMKELTDDDVTPLEWEEPFGYEQPKYKGKEPVAWDDPEITEGETLFNMMHDLVIEDWNDISYGDGNKPSSFIAAWLCRYKYFYIYRDDEESYYFYK